MTDEVLTEILAELRALNAKVPEQPKPPQPKTRVSRPGRVFSNGQLIPMDVDLVIAGAQRWIRIRVDGEPSDLWTPRDVAGPELSSNELLSRAGHVVEVPAPEEPE